MQIDLILELTGTVFSLAYLALLMLNRIEAWPFGILSSLVMAVSFYRADLQFELITYLFYAVMGIYGWYFWLSNRSSESGRSPIVRWPVTRHIGLSLFLVFPAVLFGYLGKGDLSYFDAFTSVFAFFATFLEARKVLGAWIYWILLNAASIILYAWKGLEIYAVLMVVYTVLSVFGFINWLKVYRNEQSVAL